MLHRPLQRWCHYYADLQLLAPQADSWSQIPKRDVKLKDNKILCSIS